LYLPFVGLRVVALDVKDRRDAVETADSKHHVIDHLFMNAHPSDLTHDTGALNPWI